MTSQNNGLEESQPTDCFDKVDENTNPINNKRPVIFLSHRHQDKELADLIKSFIEVRSNDVEVFSSSYDSGGPIVGNLLSQDLGRRLAEAEVVFLLYTTNDERWAYCMWEVGVAFDPTNISQTRIVVLQAGDDIPAPLGDRKAVRLSQTSDVTQFVGQLFTDSSFFPRYKNALWPSRSADSDPVKKSAGDLSTALKKVGILPEPESSWEAWPLITFSLPLQSEAAAKKLYKELYDDHDHDRSKLEKKLHGFFSENLRIERSTRDAGEAFGIRIEENSTLKDLIESWTMNKDGAEPSWSYVLCEQIARVASWNWPKPEYYGMVHAQDDRARVPMITAVRKKPATGIMEFDILFPRIRYNEEKAVSEIKICGVSDLE